MLILSCLAAIFALHYSSSCRSAESYGHSDFAVHDGLDGRRSLSPPWNNELQTLLARSAREASPPRSDVGSVSDLRDLAAVLVSQLPLPRTQPNRPVDTARVGFARSRTGSSVVARTGAMEGEWPRGDIVSDLAAVLAAQLPPLRRVSTCASALTYHDGIVSALSESVRRCSS